VAALDKASTDQCDSDVLGDSGIKTQVCDQFKTYMTEKCA